MKFLWCDTETTGLRPENAAPFQIAFILVYSYINEDGKALKMETEKVFYLNPFDIDGIEYSEYAGKVHGYTREQIETFEKSSIIVKQIDDFLKYWCNFGNPERLFFCGYNAQFDNDHIKALFNHYNLNFEHYFIKVLDVFNQVKLAGSKKILPYLPNRKLVTIADYLHIPLDNAHDALGDIKATREVAKSLAAKGIKLQ